MQTRVQKWGNSLAIRIPKPLAEQAGLENQTEVELSVDDGRLRLEALHRPLTLEELVADITPETIHGEVDFGSPVGLEEI